MKPSPNGENGRAGNGRFTKGNAGGPGNPHGQRVAALRAALLDAVTEVDLRQVVAKLVKLAKGGDLAAVRELFDRLFGKSPAAVALDVTTEVPSIGTVEERRERVQAIIEKLGLQARGNSSQPE